jgi:hypothetical protein
MKSKKIKILLSICGVIIILLIILLVINNLLLPKNKVKKDLESTLNCIINNDFSNGFYYMNINGYIQKSINMTEFDNMVAANVNFKVLNVEIEKNEAIAKIEMEYPNLEKQLDTLTLNKLTEKSFDVQGAEKVHKKFDIYLINNNEHWMLLQNKELMDVFTGGLSSVYSKKEKEIYEKLLEEVK